MTELAVALSALNTVAVAWLAWSTRKRRVRAHSLGAGFNLRLLQREREKRS